MLSAWGQVSREMTLNLVEEAGFNEITIDLRTDIGNARDVSAVSGTMVARVNLFPESRVLRTDEFTVLSADIAGSDITLAGGNFLAAYDFTGVGLGFSAMTTTPPGRVDLESGEFEASQHEVTMNEGRLSGRAGSIITGFEEVDFDFSEEGFTGQGKGRGTVTIVRGRIEGRRVFFQVSIELPAEIDQEIQLEDAPITASIRAEGHVKARGETFIEVPDFASWAEREGVLLGRDSAGREGGFDMAPASPNFILFALGFDRESVPEQLFRFSPRGVTLEVGAGLAAGDFEIQWSDDLSGWERVPETAMLNGQSAFRFGDSLSEEITVRAEERRKFLRVAVVERD